jgi:alkanesulfonate monooxygenase SsuD/methylene tetrahydromethanopterin reductase-like flavin-dependent oxidoreductase (luciferase family)
MKFGVQIPQEGARFADVLAHAREAELLGYDSVFVPDHLAAVAVPAGTPCEECWTVLTGVLMGTERVHGGPLVLSEAFRNPALLANMAATLNGMSGGRLILGIGAGWYEGEYRAYGFDWADGATRVERLDEALQIVKRLWARSGEAFRGAHYEAGGTRDCPPADVPIWVGGRGPRLLEVVARHATAWNAPVLSPDEVAERAAWLKARRPDIEITYEGPVWIDADGDKIAARMARNAQSDNATARRYAQTAIAGTPEQVVARIREYEAAGVTHLVCHFGRTTDLRGTRLFAETVFPSFR